MRYRTRAALTAPLLVGALLLTGCGSGGGGGSVSETAADAPAAEAPPSAGSEGNARAVEDGEGGAAVDGAETRPQSAPELPATHLVRTARLTVVTDEVLDGYAEAVALAERAGGYVSEESTGQRDGRQTSRITMRVPPEEYAGLLGDLSRLGELKDREVSTEDVTSEVVDVDSRVATQEESVARVRALMSEATSLGDVVTLESELTSRQAELEALKARQKSLSERTGMATVVLTLQEEPAEGPEEQREEDDDRLSIGGALGGGWNAFLGMLLWIGVAIGASLPFVATAALLFWLYRRLARRNGWWAARTPAAPPRPATPAPGAD